MNNGANGTYGGGTFDGFISKFQDDLSSNALVWSTYMGGSNSDQVSSLDCDSGGNVYVAGRTNSDSLSFPLTNPSGTWDYYQGTKSGGYDLFVSEFSVSGPRLWSTYYGGASNETSVGIALDSHNNVYVAASIDSTFCPIPSPNLLNGYYSNYSGFLDGLLAVFNPFHGSIWTTYFGGIHGELNHSIATFSNSRLYMVGGTQTDSTTFPDVALAGAYNNSNRTGFFAGYIAGFDLAPVIISSTNEIVNTDDDFIVFPNPTSNSINISLNSIKQSDIQISILNILGQTLLSENIKGASGNINKKFVVENLAKGIYIVSVIKNGTISSKKFIIQ